MGEGGEQHAPTRAVGAVGDPGGECRGGEGGAAQAQEAEATTVNVVGMKKVPPAKSRQSQIARDLRLIADRFEAGELVSLFLLTEDKHGLWEQNRDSRHRLTLMGAIEMAKMGIAADLDLEAEEGGAA